MKSSWIVEHHRRLFDIILLTVFAVVLGWVAHAVYASNEQSHPMQSFV